MHLLDDLCLALEHLLFPLLRNFFSAIAGSKVLPFQLELVLTFFFGFLFFALLLELFVGLHLLLLGGQLFHGGFHALTLFFFGLHLVQFSIGFGGRHHSRQRCLET